MARKRAGKGDHKMFRRTAVKSKKININPTIYRGGIRL
uniref:Uncharacterized protein n=4 Tax=unclassified Microvirus TaxID=338099 RepID=A0AAU8B460_9VIRU